MFKLSTTTQLFAISLILLIKDTFQFRMGMVINTPRATVAIPTSPTLAGEVTSGLISGLAIRALKRRLADSKMVDCIVNAEPRDLLRGKVGPVVVKGRGWMSPKGLTCRSIEAVVKDCSLDMTSVMHKQKLRLNYPANGSAMVAFDANDFGNFLTHSLLVPPSHRFIMNDKIMNDEIKFLKEGVSIDPIQGAVTFYINFLQVSWKCVLERTSSKGGGAKVQVSFIESSCTLSKDEISLLKIGLSKTMTNFFNNLVINLDGAFIKYKDMMVIQKSKIPYVLLSLELIVQKFPSRSISF